MAVANECVACDTLRRAQVWDEVHGCLDRIVRGRQVRPREPGSHRVDSGDDPGCDEPMAVRHGVGLPLVLLGREIRNSQDGPVQEGRAEHRVVEIVPRRCRIVSKATQGLHADRAQPRRPGRPDAEEAGHRQGVLPGVVQGGRPEPPRLRGCGRRFGFIAMAEPQEIEPWSVRRRPWICCLRPPPPRPRDRVAAGRQPHRWTRCGKPG